LAFSTAIQLPATTALPIPLVGCATRHSDLPILEGGSAKKRTPWLLLYKLGLRGTLLLYERIQAELTIKRFSYAWFASQGTRFTGEAWRDKVKIICYLWFASVDEQMEVWRTTLLLIAVLLEALVCNLSTVPGVSAQAQGLWPIHTSRV